MSGGRVLGGIVHAQVAFRAKWRLRVKALQAKVTELKATIAARKVHMQEETARALAQERDREAYATIAERESESELASKLGVTRIHVLPPPYILG